MRRGAIASILMGSTHHNFFFFLRGTPGAGSGGLDVYRSSIGKATGWPQWQCATAAVVAATSYYASLTIDRRHKQIIFSFLTIHQRRRKHETLHSLDPHSGVVCFFVCFLYLCFFAAIMQGPFPIQQQQQQHN